MAVKMKVSRALFSTCSWDAQWNVKRVFVEFSGTQPWALQGQQHEVDTWTPKLSHSSPRLDKMCPMILPTLPFLSLRWIDKDVGTFFFFCIGLKFCSCASVLMDLELKAYLQAPVKRRKVSAKICRSSCVITEGFLVQLLRHFSACVGLPCASSPDV